MLGWAVAVWVLALILLAPVSTLLLQTYFEMGGQLVVGNEELIEWLLTPIGVGYLLFASGLTLITLVIHYTGLFYLITDDVKGKSLTVSRIVVKILPRIPLLFKLCVLTVLLALGLMLPLFAGLAGVYVTFLTDFDINYYLTVRPSEWYYALFAAFLISGLWVCSALYVVTRSLMGLPAYLSGYRPFYRAIRRSWNLASRRVGRLFRLLLFSIGVWLLIRFSITFLLFFTGSAILDWLPLFSSSLRLLVLATALFLAVSFVMDTLISFIGISFVSTVITKFYHEDSGLDLGVEHAPLIRAIPGTLLRNLLPWLRPVRIIPLMLLFITGSLFLSGYLLNRVPDLQDVAISAHRAGPPPSPENTLSALERAITAGADYTEIDVQLTRDGVAVLVHDEDYMRVTGDARRVSETDFSDLRELVQRPDDGSPDSLRRLVTLEDFLRHTGERIRPMIELKYYGWNPALAEEVIRVIREQEAESRVLLMSLNLDAVRQLRELAPDIPAGYVTSVTIGDASMLPIRFLAVAHQAIHKDLIRSAHSQGLEVFVWTVNRANRMADMIELGVDGIITDDPELAVRVREEMERLSPAERILLRVRGLLEEDL